MTALEIRAAKRYWQMTSDNSAFPAPFSDHKTVGIIWSVKADYNTWFGDLVEFIHCIQMIPFVPISEELLGKEWIQEEYEVLKVNKSSSPYVILTLFFFILGSI